MIDAGLILAYILIGLCALAAIVLPIMQSLGNPASLKKGAMGVGLLIVLFGICYAISSDDTLGADITESGVRSVGAGLTMFYILVFVAIGGIIYTEFSKATK
jgi:hypothetical protein